MAAARDPLPVVSRVAVPAAELPRLTVVVDTEEEFDWDAPVSRSSTGVTAMRHIGRVQSIFDRYGVQPTYVVDYPVATQAGGYEPLQAILEDRRCAIGAHLHPWVNPPHAEAVTAPNSFTCNLPPALQREKIAWLTEAITQRFGVPPRMFKMGRYGIGAGSLEVLRDFGFDIDGSICPRYDFSGEGGPSFSGYDSSIFFSTPSILEIPCTVDYTGWGGTPGRAAHRLATRRPWSRLRAPGVLARLGVASRVMLSPEGNTFEEMRALTVSLVGRGQRVFTLSFHSPSVEPGHTPYVRTSRDLDTFLGAIDRYCAFFMQDLNGRPATAVDIRTMAETFAERMT